LRKPIIPGLKEREQSTSPLHRPITSQLELMVRLRRVRTATYLKLFSELDVHSQVKINVDTIIKSIEQEFSDVPPLEQLIGIVAKCYLEDGYDVHLLDRGQTIIQHVKKIESLPVAFDRARGVALHASYLFIEVYKDCLRAVTTSGEVSVVEG
jgi:hypothetical protein